MSFMGDQEQPPLASEPQEFGSPPVASEPPESGSGDNPYFVGGGTGDNPYAVSGSGDNPYFVGGGTGDNPYAVSGSGDNPYFVGGGTGDNPYTVSGSGDNPYRGDVPDIFPGYNPSLIFPGYNPSLGLEIIPLSSGSEGYQIKFDQMYIEGYGDVPVKEAFQILDQIDRGQAPRRDFPTLSNKPMSQRLQEIEKSVRSELQQVPDELPSMPEVVTNTVVVTVWEQITLPVRALLKFTSEENWKFTYDLQRVRPFPYATPYQLEVGGAMESALQGMFTLPAIGAAVPRWIDWAATVVRGRLLVLPTLTVGAEAAVGAEAGLAVRAEAGLAVRAEAAVGAEVGLAVRAEAAVGTDVAAAEALRELPAPRGSSWFFSPRGGAEARFNGNAYSFGTEVDQVQVEALGQKILSNNPHAAIYIATGGHGNAEGISFITSAKIGSADFVRADFDTSASLGNMELKKYIRVLNVSDPKQLKIFKEAERMALEPGQDHIYTIRSYCYSFQDKALPDPLMGFLERSEPLWPVELRRKIIASW